MINWLIFANIGFFVAAAAFGLISLERRIGRGIVVPSLVLSMISGLALLALGVVQSMG